MLTRIETGALKKFRRTAWRFQQTFETPLKALGSFAAAMLSAVGELKSGMVIIDAVVMSTTKLEALLAAKGLPKELRHETAIVVETAAEVPGLLAAALGDGVDFLFVPAPKPFVLYADHDEYATVFAMTAGHLSKVAGVLKEQGFRAVDNYERRV